jgi:hypothetical protein
MFNADVLDEAGCRMLEEANGDEALRLPEAQAGHPGGRD